MDSINQIIKNLKKEEIRSFKLFTSRYLKNEETKIANLFDKIRLDEENIDEEKLVKEFFPGEPLNFNAFYRLKNRLKTELEKSLLNLHHDLDEKISLMNMVNLANIFSYKSQYSISVYYLRKAEKLALNNEFYDILDMIYSELINLSFLFDDLDPVEFIEKRKENAEKNKISIQANQAISVIRYRLKRTNFSKSEEDINDKLKSI
jgi:hypothetical protein